MGLQMREKILRLLDVAETAEAGSVLGVMGDANDRTAQDVPVAAEMLGLLRHFLGSLAFVEAPSDGPLPMSPGVYARGDGQLVALLPIGADELALIAYWISESLQSPTVSALPGLLALPFAIEEHEGTEWLIPEWFALYYVDSSDEHCIPVLTLRSVLEDGRFGDWVTVALARADFFGLPTQAAAQAASRVIPRKSISA